MKVHKLVFFLLFSGSACQSPENIIQNRTVTACEYGIAASDSIAIPATYSTNYKAFKNIRIGKIDYHIGYNPARDQLEFINLHTNQVVPEKNIDLSTIDERGVKRVDDFLYHADDAIFLVNETAIYKINHSGILLDKWLINRMDSPIQGINFEEYTLNPNPNCPIYYSEANQHLYMLCRSLLHSQFDFDYFRTPLLASIDLRINQATLLPVYYPAYMLEERYGLAHRPRFSFTEAQVIVGFDQQSASTAHHFSSQITQELTIPTLNAPLKAKPLTGPNDPVLFKEHAETNPSYLGNIWLPEDKLFVRPFFAPRPADRTSGRGKLYLSIWSPDNTSVNELEIPSYLNPQHYFLSAKGIGFKNMQQSTDEMLVINYINYDCP